MKTRITIKIINKNKNKQLVEETKNFIAKPGQLQMI
jgi:hypothetical protein